MDQQIDQVSQWLESQKGNILFIKKEELETGKDEVMNTDNVRFTLDSVDVKNNKASIDDYIPSKEIILHGSGTVQTDEGPTDLPSDVYEIPLGGEIKTEKDNNGVKLETEDVIYTIFAQSR
ncbi:hypothetical protein [Bacillus sp. FJAT-44742]|uniref:hypothetical protein n=1 Tax=Bacillus sp. FJAT-44742 TaxID=2014005 RepID=UPI000C2332E5|nr:hypothetical protein [Bacillus sp. FJAT-44742]